ncbi:MAG: SPFH domain-containing protein [Firmicutes bacterium]|nr:SPFH domain-containing protein [Bacillota bacterium]
MSFIQAVAKKDEMGRYALISEFAIQIKSGASIAIPSGFKAVIKENGAKVKDARGETKIFDGGERYKIGDSPKGLKKIFGGKAIECRVYLVKVGSPTKWAWGITDLHFEDQKLGLPMRVGANGEFEFKIVNVERALDKLDGYAGAVTERSVYERLKSEITEAAYVACASVLASNSRFKLDSKRLEMKEIVISEISGKFKDFGLSLIGFTTAGFTEPNISGENLKRVEEIALERLEYTQLKDMFDNMAKAELEKGKFLADILKGV